MLQTKKVRRHILHLLPPPFSASNYREPGWPLWEAGFCWIETEKRIGQENEAEGEVGSGGGVEQGPLWRPESQSRGSCLILPEGSTNRTTMSKDMVLWKTSSGYATLSMRLKQHPIVVLCIGNKCWTWSPLKIHFVMISEGYLCTLRYGWSLLIVNRNDSL